jgi:methylated-DNA-[protein]-cysteine S-methyltransferase
MKELEHALRSAPATAAQAQQAADRFVVAAAESGLVDVAVTMVDSPFGPLLAAATPRGLVRLSYDEDGFDEAVRELAQDVSPRVLETSERLDDVRRELDAYFEGRLQGFRTPVDWSLSRGFSRRVLQATARIPYGSVSTYSGVAAKAGNGRASRAAGNALASNPIPIVVPCHRVVRTGGGLGGYTGGLDRKEFLLRLEGALSD